ncbi:Xaa-Pro dipeptidase [Acinetobacter baumannii]|nr:Xaa-Pro dipeptidase [Acinetobacter baumannii]
MRYTDYHVQMHQRIAKLLKNHKLVNGLSEEAMVETGITTPFLPHGLGHPLGLQVHDAAGFMQDEQGTHLAAPSKYPFLRCTRVLQPGMVCTSSSLCWRRGAAASSSSTSPGIASMR